MCASICVNMCVMRNAYVCECICKYMGECQCICVVSLGKNACY